MQHRRNVCTRSKTCQARVRFKERSFLDIFGFFSFFLKSVSGAYDDDCNEKEYEASGCNNTVGGAANIKCPLGRPVEGVGSIFGHQILPLHL